MGAGNPALFLQGFYMPSRSRLFSKVATDVDASGNLKAEAIASDVSFGATVYQSTDNLPYVGNSTGDQAYVKDNNRFYIWDSAGWYNVALINRAPAISSVQDSDGNTTPFTLAIDGTATTITITAADSDGDPITYSATADSDFNGLATVSDSDNVFTITPFSQDSATTSSGTITFKATDGVNIASSGVQTFTLNFLSALWDETVLSIGMADSDGLDNSTFVDRSTNTHTVTPTGTPIQTAFHPYLENWCVEFDGSGDYLTITSDTTLEIGTGDFTIDFWFYANDITTTQGLVAKRTSSVTDFWRILITSGQINWDEKTSNNSLGTVGTTDINAGQWHHVACVRSSGTITFFLDGVSKGTVSNTRDLSFSSQGFRIGALTNGDQPFDGKISNVRLIKGTALYTANFTPSTEKLTAVSGTSLLTCQSNRFIDNSSNDHSITVNGDPKISSSNPFGQGSEYAAGENKGSTYFNNYTLSVPNSTDFNFSSSADFTLEAWIYRTGDNGQYAEWIIGKRATGSPYPFSWYMAVGSDNKLYLADNANNVRSTTVFNQNEWYHVAATMDNGDARIFVNGVLEATSASLSISEVDIPVTIGNYSVDTPEFIGYISDLKVTKGTAAYTATFTPPTSPVGNTNASLYLPMDNAGIYDKTGNNILTLVGNTSTSNTQTKFADTAMYFDGSGDGVEFGDQTTLKYLHDKTSNYTIECWMYPTSVSGRRAILMTGAASASTGALLELNGSEVDYTIYRGVSGSFTAVSGGTVTVNQWSHVAVTYDGTDVEVFLNGTSIGSTAWSLAGSSSSSQVVPSIGRDNASSAVGDFVGYLENLQILNGVAKYTANFTVPDREQGRTYQAED